MYLRTLLLQTCVSVSTVSAINLFVAASDGNVTTLSLSGSNKAYNLSVTSVTSQCQANPSHLNLDYHNRILYCLDRGSSSSTNGSLNSFSIGKHGNLSRIDRVDAPLSGVFAEFFGDETRGIATVSYNRSAASVIGISKKGKLDGPRQIIFPTIEKTGPVALRQDLSYLHQVVLDPDQKYLITPDLGGDRVRVWSWDQETLAPLTELDQLHTDPGTGPRHGVFWRSPKGELHYIFVGELSQKVYTYKIEYTDTGLAWTKLFEIPALGVGNEKPAQTSPVSEIALSPDGKFVIVSNRDVSFPQSTQYGSGPTDTLSTFRVQANGTLSLIQLAPSGGWSPRQFSINKAGNLVAVGHQGNKTVVIWRRDVKSGKILTEKPAGIVTLTGAVVLTIFDEA